jgi:tRNA-dependent cyclodipeptide synthase
MQLYKVRGGTEEDLYAKKYNIGVGISLGNRWFSAENIVLLTEWALEHTKDFVVVYVADSIHAINIEVRNRKSSQKALEVAQKMGNAILQEVRLLAESRLSPEQLSKIRYEKWDGLITPAFQEKLDWLNTKYQTDNNFRAEIIKLVDGFTNGENRVFDEDDKVKLGSYVIAEFPEILTRAPINGLSFDAYAYPFDGKLVEFIEDIQKGLIFPEIREAIMDTEPKVFLEVRE